MSTAIQLEIFPSMAMHERKTMRVQDIAAILNCSLNHVNNLLIDGTIGGKGGVADISRNGDRVHWRIAVEAWHDYVMTNFGSFDRITMLKPLSDTQLDGIINDCYAIKRQREEKRKLFKR